MWVILKKYQKAENLTLSKTTWIERATIRQTETLVRPFPKPFLITHLICDIIILYANNNGSCHEILHSSMSYYNPYADYKYISTCRSFFFSNSSLRSQTLVYWHSTSYPAFPMIFKFPRTPMIANQPMQSKRNRIMSMAFYRRECRVSLVLLVSLVLRSELSLPIKLLVKVH
jgi:hypothetical protein